MFIVHSIETRGGFPGMGHAIEVSTNKNEPVSVRIKIENGIYCWRFQTS